MCIDLLQMVRERHKTLSDSSAAKERKLPLRVVTEWKFILSFLDFRGTTI